MVIQCRIQSPTVTNCHVGLMGCHTNGPSDYRTLPHQLTKLEFKEIKASHIHVQTSYITQMKECGQIISPDKMVALKNMVIIFYIYQQYSLCCCFFVIVLIANNKKKRYINEEINDYQYVLMFKIHSKHLAEPIIYSYDYNVYNLHYRFHST